MLKANKRFQIYSKQNTSIWIVFSMFFLNSKKNVCCYSNDY